MRIEDVRKGMILAEGRLLKRRLVLVLSSKIIRKRASREDYWKVIIYRPWKGHKLDKLYDSQVRPYNKIKIRQEVKKELYRAAVALSL